MEIKVKSITYGIGMSGGYGKVKVEMTNVYEDVEQEDIDHFEKCRDRYGLTDDTFADTFEKNYEAWIIDVDYEVVKEDRSEEVA